MKDFTYHSYGSHVGRMNYGGGQSSVDSPYSH